MGVFLYTRPRRFGKTTNITMLDAFFNIDYSGNGWFDGLKIMDHPEYGSYMNAFPWSSSGCPQHHLRASTSS